MEYFQNLQQTVNLLQHVDWKSINKPDLEKLAQQLDLDMITQERKEALKQRLKDRYELARSSLQQFSPKRPPPAEVEAQADAPVPVMADLADNVSPPTLSTPSPAQAPEPQELPDPGFRRASPQAVQNFQRIFRIRFAGSSFYTWAKLRDPDNDPRIPNLEANIRSLTVAHHHNLNQQATHAQRVDERLGQVEEDQATVAILQQTVTDLHADIVSLRRDLHRVEGQARGERVQLAQQGPIGGAASDDQAVLALKLAGRSPSISAHIAQIGKNPKITRVASVLAATTELNMELATWKGTPYGLDRATHEPLCRLIISKFPDTLISELRYNTTLSSAELKHPTNFHKMMQTLLAVAMQLDQGTATTLEYIQRQNQGSRSIIEHITAMRFLTDLIPAETQASLDFRRALWNTFNYDTRANLANLNPKWKTTNDLYSCIKADRIGSSSGLVTLKEYSFNFKNKGHRRRIMYDTHPN
jgi:hypothetical protein